MKHDKSIFSVNDHVTINETNSNLFLLRTWIEASVSFIIYKCIAIKRQRKIHHYIERDKSTTPTRCPWCNGYRHRIWTRRYEFNSWTDCISNSTNTLEKGMNPIILPPARFFSLGEATSLGEGKTLNSNLLNSALKIDLVSYPARAEGLVGK